MKRILITGANSYIGTSFEKYMDDKEGYEIDTLDMRNQNWVDHDFSKYDVVFHVAGIAHIKETKENKCLYYEINRDLAVQVANKAKSEKVKQFIFMSSMSIYGLDSFDGLINLETEPNPKTNYGKSKFEAEQLLSEIEDKQFGLSIIRAPMVYGHNSPGNLGRLFRVVRKVHIFPKFNNQRSTIAVEKLSIGIKDIIDRNKRGVFLLQNEEYMCTYQTVREQMEKEKIKVLYTSAFNPLIRFFTKKIILLKKTFGDLKFENEQIKDQS